MNWLQQFWARRTAWAHGAAALIAALVATYSEVPSFHDFVNSAYRALPSHLQSIISVALTLALWYTKTRKTWTPLERVDQKAIEVANDTKTADMKVK